MQWIVKKSNSLRRYFVFVGHLYRLKKLTRQIKEKTHPNLSNFKTHFGLRKSWGRSHLRPGNYIKDKSLLHCPSLAFFFCHLLQVSGTASPRSEKSRALPRCHCHICSKSHRCSPISKELLVNLK